MSLRKKPTLSNELVRRPKAALDPVKRPERLVGLGFRCWIAGFETQDINCWETGWNTFATELGPGHAKAAITELSCWVRMVHTKTCRRISYYPFGCKGFCRDECMAISMIAAGQHAACPAMRACAFALLNTNDIDGVVDTATNFAEVLKDAGHILSGHSICEAGILTDSGAEHAGYSKH
ncbi:MAG: hypothetical protein MPJ78_08320 [Hyphomicrobiaceae bacterium]|nr:hypothetical protein [Hyphomicrobiaceae bacterium]